MKKRIAFYISTLTAGGAERVISNLANEYARKGYQVYMITERMEDREYHKLHEAVERVLLPELTQGRRLANAVSRVTNLRKTVKKLDVDALVSFIGKTNIRAVLATRFMRTKVIVSVRSAPAREYGSALQRLLAKGLFRLAEGIVFQTEEAQKFFSKTVQKKSVILMNPLHPDFMRKRYEGQRKQEIVTVGRLHKVKNHEMLIRVFSRILPDYQNYTLHICGDGDNRENLVRLIGDCGLEDKVILEGDCSDVPELIRDKEIFVLSSDVEGMPNALLEAMALGLAVISTDCPCGGPRAVIRNGENGLLVPVGDGGAMEQALRKLLSDPELSERLGREAEKIKEEMAPEKVNGMWMDYIERV